ncbi:MAG: glycosyltransferase [Myxococcales bacterium]|nr:glycosyltransferase [Myxococcales bacterium]
MSALAWALVAAPSLVPFAMTAWNLATWSRGPADAPVPAARVSVLVPARNAERHVEDAVRAIAASAPWAHEIVVCDDGSTDATAEILARLARELPLLRVVRAAPLPPGWVGKPHACATLARVATGDLFVYVDVDVRVAPGGIARLVALCADADVATAVPEQRTGSFFEGLVLPLLGLTYTAWLPLGLVRRSRDPRFVAACGQLLAVRREALERIGGFEAVRSEIVDDVAFCRRAKELGERVVFADGLRMASCRMYESRAELWRGFAKNLYEGIGATRLALALVVALYLGCFVGPYVALPVALGLGEGATAVALAAGVGVGANVLLRALLAARLRQPWWSVALHPLGVLALVGLAWTSYRWHARGAQEWSGRRYAPRAARLEEVQS